MTKETRMPKSQWASVLSALGIWTWSFVRHYGLGIRHWRESLVLQWGAARPHYPVDCMIIAPENSPAKIEPKVRPAAASTPVVKPRKSVARLFGEVFSHGGPGYLQFAITNICNAKCDF